MKGGCKPARPYEGKTVRDSKRLVTSCLEMVDISISKDKIVISLTIAEVVSVGTDQLTLSVNPPILYRERLLRLLAGKRASYTSDFYKKLHTFGGVCGFFCVYNL